MESLPQVGTLGSERWDKWVTEAPSGGSGATGLGHRPPGFPLTFETMKRIPRTVLTSLVFVIGLAACASPTASPPPPIVEGDPLTELATVRQGLTSQSFLTGFTEPDGRTWFGGVGGALLTRQGSGPWSFELLPGFGFVTGIWGTAEELLAVADFTLHLRVGNNWEPVALPLRTSQFLELWGLDGDHVWIGGAGGAILFREGGAWQIANVPVSAEIWGFAAESPDDVVAVGQSGTILQSTNGLDWETVPSPTSSTLFAVASDGNGRYVAVGGSGTILLRDGDTWEMVPSPVPANLFDVQSTGPGAFTVVGDDGVVLTGNGIQWSVVDVAGGVENFRAIAGTPGALTVAGWFGTVVEQASGWKTTQSGTRIYAVHAPASGKALAVGQGGIAFERSATSWVEVSVPTHETLLGIAGPSATDRLVVGDQGTAFHYDGMIWTPEAVPATKSVRSVWYNGTRAMAVGEDGVAMVREQGSWRAIPTNTTRFLRHVFGISWDRLYAVGDSGTLLRWDGQSFATMAVPVTHNLRGGISRSQFDHWVVGDVGTILHLEGGAWVKQFPATLNNIRAVHAVDNVLYFAGELGLAYHRDGESWTPMLTSNPEFWLGLGGEDELVAVGEFGTIAEGRR
jgi:hypothetical protein